MRRERKVIGSSSVERRREGEYLEERTLLQAVKEESGSGNILLFQTYIKHDTNTPSDKKVGEEEARTVEMYS